MCKIKTNTCWNCGELFATENDCSERFYCEECRKTIDEKYQIFLNKYIDMKTVVMWNRAVRTMERQPKLNINHYYDEANYVKELASKDHNKFQSSAEMIAAIQLLKQRVRAKAQYKILRYRVDFLLPNLKTVLEVDGNLHKYKIKKDSNRDIAIMAELNKDDEGWEIVRIPSKYIEENVRQLVPAILAMRKEKRRLRKENGGFMPASFSRRDAYINNEIAKMVGNKKDERLMTELLENTEPSEL